MPVLVLHRIAPVVFLAIGTCYGDTVTLRNGERLTGDIQKLEQSRLVLKTEYAGVITIDWKTVETVATVRPYRIEAESGAKFSGIIRPAPAGLEVVSHDTAAIVSPLAVKSIAELPVGGALSFWRQVEGRGEFGYSLAKNNSALNQSSLAFDLRYPAEKHKIDFTLTSLFSRQAAAPATSAHVASLRYDRFLGPRSFVFGFLDYPRCTRIWPRPGDTGFLSKAACASPSSDALRGASVIDLTASLRSGSKGTTTG